MRAHARTDEGGVSQRGDGHSLLHHHSWLVEGQAQGLLSRVPVGREPRVTALEGSLLGELLACCPFSVGLHGISLGAAAASVPPVWTAGRCRASSPDC